MIKTTSETVIPEYSSWLLRIRLDNDANRSDRAIAEISCPDHPYLVGGPGLVTLDGPKDGLVEIFNTGPKPVTLARGQVVGKAYNANHQMLVPFEAKAVNKIAEEQWRKSQMTSPKPLITDNFPFQKMCRLEVPARYEGDYCQLLAKHQSIFSLNKNEIGYCNTFLHKLFMKTDYVKQFKIPEAHHRYLQDQVQECLRLGIIQPSLSRYN
jgi:hypothetical protein